jgi:hypothetical protein
VRREGNDLQCRKRTVLQVSRTETGQHGAPPRAIRDLCEFYGVTDDAQIARLLDLARGGKEQGWWQTYDLEFSTYVGL